MWEGAAGQGVRVEKGGCMVRYVWEIVIWGKWRVSRDRWAGRHCWAQTSDVFVGPCNGLDIVGVALGSY